MENDLVSVITPSYNSSLYIEATIQSILAQTYSNWELLITDDCSTDNTIDIVNRYVQQDSRIKLFCLEKNSGAGIARNHSIREARGRYIAFCDSDDRWLPEKLERQIAFMKKKDAAFSYTSYYVCSEGEEIRGKILCKPTINYYSLLKDNSIGCLTAMYDTHILGKMYMPEIRKRQDWGLWFLIIKKIKIAYGLQEPLAIYRVRKSSVSSNKWNLIKFNLNVYRTVLHFSFLQAWCTFLFLFLPTYMYKKWRQQKNSVK